MGDNEQRLLELLEDARIKHADDQTAGAIDALGAVIWYLRSGGVAEAHTLPLMWLAHDLIAKPVGNSKSVFIGGREGMAVAAVDALKDSGLKLATALAEVSNSMGGEMTETQIKNWRQSLKLSDKRTPAKQQYEATKSRLATLRNGEFADASDAFWRKAVLAMVARSYGIKKL